MENLDVSEQEIQFIFIRLQFGSSKNKLIACNDVECDQVRNSRVIQLP
jgi:hypothetical protein